MDRIDRAAGVGLLEVEASGCGCSTVEGGRSGEADMMVGFEEPIEEYAPRASPLEYYSPMSPVESCSRYKGVLGLWKYTKKGKEKRK
jgi:hypothetical protein